MTLDGLPTSEEREAQARWSFRLFCASCASTLLWAGAVAFAGAPRFMLLLVGGLTIASGLLNLLVMRLDRAVDHETGETGEAHTRLARPPAERAQSERRSQGERRGDATRTRRVQIKRDATGTKAMMTERQKAPALTRLSFGLFCWCVVMTLVIAGLVVFAGLSRIFLLPFAGVAVLNGFLYLQLLRRDEEVQDGGP